MQVKKYKGGMQKIFFPLCKAIYLGYGGTVLGAADTFLDEEDGKPKPEPQLANHSYHLLSEELEIICYHITLYTLASFLCKLFT